MSSGLYLRTEQVTMERVRAVSLDPAATDEAITLWSPSDVDSSVTMSEVYADGYHAVYFQHYSGTTHRLEITNSTLVAQSRGLYGVAGTGLDADIIVDHTRIRSGSHTVYASGTDVFVGGSQMAGTSTVGSVTCSAVYDENYDFFADTCP